MGDDTVQIRAEGWNEYISRQIKLRWPPVLQEWFPTGGDYSVDWHWLFFQYVFPLCDPRSFPSLDSSEWTPEEQARLQRYITHASDLAGSTVLTARDGYQVSIPDLSSGEWEIEETKSARDATVGFLTMFRQCYAPDEQASFKRVYDLVSREAHKAGMPRETLRAWKGAHNKVRQTHLDHLILEKAAANRLIGPHVVEGNAFEPGKVDSPEQMLSTIFYGDAIHWGDSRAVIEGWDKEHLFWGMKRRFDALRTAVQLGHLYVGFAGVVARATGQLPVTAL